MALFGRNVDISIFYRGGFFKPVRSACGKLLRPPKIVSCSMTDSHPLGDTFVESIKFESLGVPSRGNGNAFSLHDIFVRMKTKLPSGYKVPMSLDRDDLPQRVRKLFEETEKQHPFNYIVASFETNPASKTIFVNSVRLRISCHKIDNHEEWLAIFEFSKSRHPYAKQFFNWILGRE